ncbi:MAG: hypothetical protein F6K11_32860 [Leptolyngbya sp. SIO3F4]|nr:hypothetical protein [Leptolyngbya sp. SIO3F4]
MNKDLLNTVRALAPIVTNALKSGQLFSPHCELTEANPDFFTRSAWFSGILVEH